MKARSVIPLLTIIVVAALLRLPQLGTVPDWYPDEGSNIAIAASLARGNPSYLAFDQSHFINGHPPLAYYGMALLFRWFTVDIVWARLMTAMLGVLTSVLLYLVASRVAGQVAGISAAAFYAVYPGAVVLSRMAFTYNVLAPMTLMAVYGLWRMQEYGNHLWLLVSTACVAAGLLTDLAAAALLLFFGLALLFIKPRAVAWALPLSLAPLIAWGVSMWIHSGAHFLHDVSFTLGRTSPSLTVQIVRVIFYRTALEGDVWLALGGLGLLAAEDRRTRWLFGGCFWLSLIILARNSALYGQASYFLVPLFPLAALGIGVLIARWFPALLPRLTQTMMKALRPFLLPQAVRRASVFLLTAGVLFLAVGGPLLSMVAEGAWMDYTLYMSRFGTTLADPESAREVAFYVNAQTDREDVVLASPTIAWLLDAKAADFQMAIAATGQATQHFPANIPEDRFHFDPRVENALFVILDPLWRNWASAQMPEVAELSEMVDENWRLEAQFGDFDIYRNPSVSHGRKE